MKKSIVAIGFLGSTLDAGKSAARWERWRPTVSLCQHENLLVRRLDLLYQRSMTALARMVIQDIRSVSPETEVVLHETDIADPWDFEQVFGALHAFARGYRFNTEKEEYLMHITTGTHVAQICMFLLTESRHFPGKLIQTSPPSQHAKESVGEFRVIDLDLTKYDRIASRFREERREGASFLKSGIATRNERFNALIAVIEQVAAGSKEPILLTGPTGAGKSLLARRIFELKRSRHQVEGPFVEVNCATIQGDAAMSALFGHAKGAFTGAVGARKGLLLLADKGTLFLDEIGDLGIDQQTMLLRALEEKTFLPLGSDNEVHSDFQLLAGTNLDLPALVQQGRFRQDLLSRINVWTFRMPGLVERREDIEPNLDYELEQYARVTGVRVSISKEAREEFLAFAVSPRASWIGNFRDLNAAVRRMGTFAQGGRITAETVREEVSRLATAWENSRSGGGDETLERIIGMKRLVELDRFDRAQLADVVAVCRASRSLSEAGRELFAVSRQRKKQINDADRLRKYLAGFGLRWEDVGVAP